MANTVNVSKLDLCIVVGPPSDRTVVSKLSMGVVVGPALEKIQVSKISMGVVVGPVDDATYAEITQLPLLVIEASDQPSQVTQLPMMIINLPFQPSEVTQLPLLAVFTPKPTPSPLPTIPDVPVIEIWKWETALNISESGKEQRAALRSKPRISMEFTVVILDEEDRRAVYQMIFDNGYAMFNHPMYQYSAYVTQASSIGGTKIYFNPAKTDMRPGETIAVFDPEEDGSENYYTIDTVDADGVTTVELLDMDVPVYFMVAPSPKFYFITVPSISMKSIDGQAGFKVITEAGRVQLRPTQSVTLTTMDGIPILTKRPLANSDVEEAFDRNITVLDNSTAPAVLRTNYRTPFIGGKREFLAQRPADMDYWRKFSDTVRGRRTAFYLPTWRNDLPLSVQPSLGATVITTTNVFYSKYFQGASARQVMIRSRAGTIYRRVTDIVIHYNLNGNPDTVDLILSSSIGAGAGSNEDMVVSIMHLTRLNTDEITLEHHELDTIVSFDVRTIDA